VRFREEGQWPQTPYRCRQHRVSAGGSGSCRKPPGREGAKLVFEKIKGQFSRLKLIWADGAYAGQLVEWVKNTCGWLLEIVKPNQGVTGFQFLPRRWVVERTFGWFGRYRRLSEDYEFQTDKPTPVKTWF